jgi:hypothetical protein
MKKQATFLLDETIIDEMKRSRPDGVTKRYWFEKIVKAGLEKLKNQAAQKKNDRSE